MDSCHKINVAFGLELCESALKSFDVIGERHLDFRAVQTKKKYNNLIKDSKTTRHEHNLIRWGCHIPHHSHKGHFTAWVFSRRVTDDFYCFCLRFDTRRGKVAVPRIFARVNAVKFTKKVYYMHLHYKEIGLIITARNMGLRRAKLACWFGTFFFITRNQMILTSQERIRAKHDKTTITYQTTTLSRTISPAIDAPTSIFK